MTQSSHLTAAQSAQYQQAELKKELLDIVETKLAHFSHHTHLLRGADQNANHIAICDEIIEAIDQILNTGDWESSLFLRNTMRPLVKIKERALALKTLMNESQTEKRKVVKLLPHQVKLFISLYQLNGLDLTKWGDQLNTLAAHLTGRPIYQTEEDVQRAIRAKFMQATEAYIVVAVDENCIISTAQMKPRQDRLGQTLVNVMEGKITSEHILEFVHLEKRYHWINQQLIGIS